MADFLQINHPVFLFVIYYPTSLVVQCTSQALFALNHCQANNIRQHLQMLSKTILTPFFFFFSLEISLLCVCVCVCRLMKFQFGQLNSASLNFSSGFCSKTRYYQHCELDCIPYNLLGCGFCGFFLFDWLTDYLCRLSCLFKCSYYYIFADKQAVNLSRFSCVQFSEISR